MAPLKVKTNDEKIFEVPSELITCSETLAAMVNDDREGGSDDENATELEHVHSATMEKIIEWAIHHKDDPEPAKNDDDDYERRCDDISSWDANFLDVDQKMLFKIILAANFLAIPALLDVSCKAVARLIKGNSPQEIRDQFNIVNDLTPDEEDQIRRENEWCEDK